MHVERAKNVAASSSCSEPSTCKFLAAAEVQTSSEQWQCRGSTDLPSDAEDVEELLFPSRRQRSGERRGGVTMFQRSSHDLRSSDSEESKTELAEFDLRSLLLHLGHFLPG